VRTADSTAVSAVLAIHGRQVPEPPGEEPPAWDPEPGPQPIPIKHLFFLRAMHDSPAGGAVALAVGLDTATPVRVDVYDLLGRRVRSLAERDLPAGVTVLPWDGRDQSGSRVGRGVYFARLVAGPRQLTVRVLVLER
jgi:hypothetical protein